MSLYVIWTKLRQQQQHQQTASTTAQQYSTATSNTEAPPPARTYLLQNSCRPPRRKSASIPRQQLLIYAVKIALQRVNAASKFCWAIGIACGTRRCLCRFWTWLDEHIAAVNYESANRVLCCFKCITALLCSCMFPEAGFQKQASRSSFPEASARKAAACQALMMLQEDEKTLH